MLSVAESAPNPNDLKPIDKGRSSVIFAGDGTRLGVIRSDETRIPISIDKIPKDLQNATVAIEDQRFYEHNGVDAEGVTRALWANLTSGEVQQGGSTITMQLMRNLYIAAPKRDIDRKIKEADMAINFEKEHSKKQILNEYLNTASYGTLDGRTALGVQAAAKIYFNKPAKRLNLQQSAMIAGLPQAPSDYNPYLNPTGAKERRNEVLTKMADLGYITRNESLTAQQKGLQLHRTNEFTTIREPLFFDYVENELIARYGVNTVRLGGLKVYTTIDPALQETGRAAIAGALPYTTDPSAALVAIDPANGDIKAMVSSSSYSDEKYNLAAQGRRQPGSTFKAFVLTTAIKQGIDPYTTYYESKPLSLDLPEFGHWNVATSDQGYKGSINLYDATVASDNTVFAQLDLDVGPDQVAKTAHDMGITTELDSIPAEGLGGLRIGASPLEMADAYATLASGGIHHPPIAIRKVDFPGKRVDEPQPGDSKRVLSDGVAYEVTKILNANITGGTGTAAYTGCSGQAGKTGTTDNFVDAWFVGYQPNLATSVWVGYPDSNNISMSSVHGITVYGGTFPAQIWNSFYVNSAIPCETFPAPTDPVQFHSFSGSYTASAPSTDTTTDSTGSAKNKKKTDPNKYNNPDLYAPGADPAPAPAPTPAPAPSPPPGGGGGGIGGGGIGAGRVESGQAGN